MCFLHYQWKILTKLCYRLFIKTLKNNINLWKMGIIWPPLMLDLFHLLSSPDVNGVLWITCDVFIRLSFWRHPFTAETLMQRHISTNLMKKQTHPDLRWTEGEVLVNRDSPSACGWGRRFARWAGTSLDPESGRVWSCERTAESRHTNTWMIHYYKEHNVCLHPLASKLTQLQKWV